MLHNALKYLSGMNIQNYKYCLRGPLVSPVFNFPQLQLIKACVQ
jgi:hypothetical protein